MTIAYVAHVTSEKEHNEITRANMAQSDVHFLTDFRLGEYYRDQICGMQYQGVIISDDATLVEDNLLYLLGRVRHRGELVFRLGDYHKEVMQRYYDQRWETGNIVPSSYLSEDDIKEMKESDREFCKQIGIVDNF